jgi:hypothetical protein
VRNRATSILFATHDLFEAADVATHVIGLADGRVAFRREGGAPPRELEQALITAAGR